MNYMEKKYFDCSVKYDRTQDDGAQKKVTEHYIVEAMDFTSAEKRFVEFVEPFMSGDWEVDDIKKMRIADSPILSKETSEENVWYYVNALFMVMDEQGNEKNKKSCFAVESKSVGGAVRMFEAHAGNFVGDYRVTGVSEKNFMDYIQENNED